MADILVEALLSMATPAHLMFLSLGTILGLVVGILPGLGGIAGLSLLLPFMFGMDPILGLALMIGMVAVVPTSDTFASVLMGIPGSSASQATVLDGFPMAKNGQAARALSAAFASSLFGLSGSLVLGFLELQASHAHNRFYNELEEWLSGITELTPGSAGTSSSSDQLNRQLYGSMYEIQRSLAELANRLEAGQTTPPGAEADSVRELADGVNHLIQQMRQEQEIVRQWADEQATQQTEIAMALRELAHARDRG